MSHPYRIKTQWGDSFSKNRLLSTQGCILEASWSDTPAQQLLVRSCISPDNFIKILSFHQKLFNLFWRTDRQTHIHHPYTGGQNFLCRFLIDFTSLCSLCSLCLWRIWNSMVLSPDPPAVYHWPCSINRFVNGTEHIRHQCRQTTVLSCPRCLINSGVEKMNKL